MPTIKSEFELEIMRLMSEVMAHTITLHLLDAPGRRAALHAQARRPAERMPKKELASYLNLSPETLSRLKQRGKIVGSRRVGAVPGRRAAPRRERHSARRPSAPRPLPLAPAQRLNSGQTSSTSASVMMPPTSQFEKKIAQLALRHQHRLAERVLGAIAEHQREHQRRERIRELLEHVARRRRRAA